MNRNVTTTKYLVLSGLMLVLGLLLPLVTHAFGAGTVILPMHIPVLLAGMLLPLPYAFGVGLLTPVLSSLFTGMPPLLPMLPIMAVELTLYALSASIARGRFRLNPYLCLLISMIIGRIGAGLMVFALSTLFSVPVAPPLVYLSGAILTGIPGIIIQIVLIPPLTYLGERLLTKSSAMQKHENK